jgi:sulfoacetaldehyde dehydrogenase
MSSLGNADADAIFELDAIVSRSRRAQQSYEINGSQQRYDRAAQAVAWAIMEPQRNQELAELAVKTTGLGKCRGQNH